MNESVHCLPAPRLSADHWSAWEAIRSRNPALDSPYFAPGFTREVAAVREDVEIAVVERAGEPILFLPFQRGRSGMGLPVGGRLSDFHGPIAASDVRVDPKRLLESCRLERWRFDHLASSAMANFGAHIWHVDESPAIDLSEGFEAYAEERRRSGSQRIKRVRKKWRKLEREHGPAEIEIGCQDVDVFRQMCEWKSAQYREHGLPDLFASQWIVDLLTGFIERDDEPFGGMCVLRVGGRPIAVDYGLRGNGVFHSWFPSYDRDFSSYSPGNVLLLATAERAGEHGIRRVELGKGPEPYKLSFCNTSTRVGTGLVDRSPLRHWVSRTLAGTRRRLAQSWLRPALRPTLALARRMVPVW